MTFSELRGDHHVHSTFSDDAVSTIQENVIAALAVGLTELRLVEHVRADTAWLPEFTAAVAALEIPEELSVHTGVEAKILDASGELDLPPLPPGIDRVLIADHQFPGTDGPWSPRETSTRIADGRLTADGALDLLVGALIAAVGRYPGNQLAHCFSILPKIGLGEAQLGADRLAAWAAACAATQTIVEVNEKWDCPGPDALRAAQAAGVSLVASTDSHIASDVGRYDKVVGLLERAQEGSERHAGSAD